MKKFKIPSYAFDFIDGLLRTNGDITLSNKIQPTTSQTELPTPSLANPKLQNLEFLFMILTDG